MYLNISHNRITVDLYIYHMYRLDIVIVWPSLLFPSLLTSFNNIHIPVKEVQLESVIQDIVIDLSSSFIIDTNKNEKKNTDIYNVKYLHLLPIRKYSGHLGKIFDLIILVKIKQTLNRGYDVTELEIQIRFIRIHISYSI